jgi:hypothetical protein
MFTNRIHLDRGGLRLCHYWLVVELSAAPYLRSWSYRRIAATATTSCHAHYVRVYRFRGSLSWYPSYAPIDAGSAVLSSRLFISSVLYEGAPGEKLWPESSYYSAANMDRLLFGGIRRRNYLFCMATMTPNQSMKPTAPLRCNFGEVVVVPCGGLSSSR